MTDVPKLGMVIPNMGTLPDRPASESTTLADALFTPVQQRVLALLLGQAGRRFQSAELIRLAGSGTGATHRFLSRLAASGHVRVTMQGRQKYYEANTDSPVFEELAGFVRKTVGLATPLREALEPLRDRIDAAFVYGSVAAGTDHAGSDIDLMVVSRDIDYPTLFDALVVAESQLSRAISPKLATRAQWRRERSRSDTLIGRIQSGPRMFVIGSDDDLG